MKVLCKQSSRGMRGEVGHAPSSGRRAGGKCSVRSNRPRHLLAHAHLASKEPSMWGYLYVLLLSLLSHHSFSIMYSTRHNPCLKGCTLRKKSLSIGITHCFKCHLRRELKGLGKSGSPGEQAHHLPFNRKRHSPNPPMPARELIVQFL